MLHITTTCFQVVEEGTAALRGEKLGQQIAMCWCSMGTQRVKDEGTDIALLRPHGTEG